MMNISLNHNPRCYSLVLRHLSPIQCGVQTSHAASMFAFEFPKLNEHCVLNDQTLIILEVNSSKQLKDFKLMLDSLGVPNSIFKECDLDNLTTALYFMLDKELYDFDRELLKSDADPFIVESNVYYRFENNEIFNFEQYRSFQINDFLKFKRKLNSMKLKS